MDATVIFSLDHSQNLSVMKTTFTLLFALFFPFFPEAQDATVPPGEPVCQINPSFVVGVPLLDFAEKMDDTGFGAGSSFLVNLKAAPFWVGAGFDYLSFSSKRVRIREPIAQTGISRRYDWTVHSQALLPYAVLRYQPESDFFIRPYLEGKIGVRGLFTITRLDERSDSEYDVIDTRTNLSDWSFAYGGGAGLQIFFTNDKCGAFDLYCGWMRGAAADFYTKAAGAGVSDDPLDAFEKRHTSATDFLLPRIGFTILFFDEDEEK
jgi:hypothetical protein